MGIAAIGFFLWEIQTTLAVETGYRAIPQFQNNANFKCDG